MPCAKCLTRDEVLAQEQLSANDSIAEVDHPHLGTLRIVKAPPRVSAGSGWRPRARRRPTASTPTSVLSCFRTWTVTGNSSVLVLIGYWDSRTAVPRAVVPRSQSPIREGYWAVNPPSTLSIGALAQTRVRLRRRTASRTGHLLSRTHPADRHHPSQHGSWLPPYRASGLSSAPSSASRSPPGTRS